jgi:tetratricopeptide (TPR) repeat protein
MIILPVNNTLFFQILMILSILLGCVTCSPNKYLLDSGQYGSIFDEADLLFQSGNYALAKKKYMEIRDNSRQKAVVALAQYKLGYINIYHNNPFADYDEALREFKLFLQKYDNNKLAENAKSWVKIITVLQNTKKSYDNTNEALRKKEQKMSNNYFVLEDSLSRYQAIKDSLIKRIRIVEENERILRNVIDKLNKIE